MISLAAPWVLLVLPLPWVVWRFAPVHRETTNALRFPFFRQIVDATNQTPQSGSVVLRRTALQMATAIMIWVCLVLAMAGPERIGQPIEITKSARDVVLALDISGSMDERDFQTPDGERSQRFAAVQSVVSDFVAERDGDRLALIVFGSAAYMQAPLTEDLETIVELVEQTEVGMAGPHTAIGDAIGLSIRTFEASDVEERLLILLSDGSDTNSLMSPINAAEIARQEGVSIFTIAVGDPEADGENRVDLAMLSEIASRSGGESYFAGDVDALTEVYARIDELNPREVETLSYRPTQSLAHWPLVAALVLGIGVLAYLFFARARRRAMA